ncbi:hypothetical protein KI387_001117, partial [Taxus chinensis]
IIAENALNVSSHELKKKFYGFGITLAHSSDYFPQGNGQAESSNKNLVTIIRKSVDKNQ